jgi:hypothetical protein
MPHPSCPRWFGRVFSSGFAAEMYALHIALRVLHSPPILFLIILIIFGEQYKSIMKFLMRVSPPSCPLPLFVTDIPLSNLFSHTINMILVCLHINIHTSPSRYDDEMSSVCCIVAHSFACTQTCRQFVLTAMPLCSYRRKEHRCSYHTERFK